MPSDRWQRVKDVLAAVLEESPDRRPALFDELCAGDASLRLEVESLLRADAGAETFLERPLLDVDVEPPEPNIGRTLGPYVIEECIGRGGMGAVYLARRADQAFERRVAIKMIRRGMDSELVIRRFRHERQILASLEHPNVASLFDGGTTPEGLPYFVMEYVAGSRIDRYADDHRLTTVERIRLCLPILDAVQHAHDRHVVHRDIKPGNVMVTAEGHPKLLDFGIAKILDSAPEGPSTFTSLGHPMTPDYASPEQIRGEPVTALTDVYALGLLLYELLTGHRPYRLVTHTPEEMARVVCEQDPERPSAVISQVETAMRDDGMVETRTPATVSETRDGSLERLRRRLSGPLDDILLKALRKEPGQRYSSVAAFAEDLRRYASEQPLSVSWDARRYRTKRLLRRYRGAAALAALVIVVMAVTAVLTTRLRSEKLSSVSNRSGSSTQAAPRPSVAVIGFRNLPERPADQWLSAAMAEMLTTELAGDGQLRVLPPDRIARAQVDLAHNAASALSQADVERLRNALASDFAVFGTVVVTEGAAPRTLRIDVHAQRARQDPVSVSATGDEGQLFALVAQVGKDLRARLGLRESTPEATRGVRAALPQTTEATKLYAEGESRLRVLDAVAAKDFLEQAASREPGNPMIQTALAAAWTALGYDARAGSAAQKGFDSSADLGREQRLMVEGRLYEAQRKWPNAVDVYRTLWGFFSDNIEYGLQLAGAQTAAGQAADALKTLEALRHLPPPQNDDPRIDLEQAQAEYALGDFPHELAATQQAVQRAEHSGSRHLTARARLLEGRSHFNQGQLGPAEQSLEIARQMFVAVGDRAGAASALNSLASVLSDKQDLARAERMHKEAFAMSEQIGDRRGMSAALNNLGIVLKDQRRFDEARQAHERALALRREIADPNWIAISLSNTGVVLFEQDQLREAAMYYKESLAICREIGDRRGQVRALHNLAIVDRELGNLPAARSGYETSLVTRAEIGDKRGGVMGRVELGMVLLAQGELDLARQTEEEAVRLAREVGLKPGEAQALYQLGEIALASGDLALARRDHEEALAVRRTLDETRTIAESRLALANLALEESRADEAEREARNLLSELPNEREGPLQMEIQILIARARLAAGDPDAADRSLTAARRLSHSTERIDAQRSLTMAESELDAARNHPERARERLTALRARLARAGMTLAELECRMALLRLDLAEKRPTAHAEAVALEKDARARRAGLILRHVQAL
jgi:serine/threonine protein kinase/tetratricopeptide (TPR) repeat protein